MDDKENGCIVYGHSDDMVYVSNIHKSFTLPLNEPLTLDVDGVVLRIDYNANGEGEWTIEVLDDYELDVTVHDTDYMADVTNDYTEVAHIPSQAENVRVVV